MTKSIAQAAALALASTAITIGGTFTSDFSNPAQTGFTLNGGTRPDGVTPYPVIENGYLALTYNENSQQASIVLDDLDGGAAVESLTARFKLQLGPGSGNPADGFSVSFGPDILSSSNPGEEGTGNGLIVVLDTYDNGGAEAPAIEVKYGGAVLGHAAFAKADLVTSSFEDVLIELKRSGTVNVAWRGVKVFENLVIPGYAPTQGQLVLGARTGGENHHTRIDDLTVTTVKAGAAATPSITSQPSSVTVAERGTAVFTFGFDGSAPLTFKWFKNNAEIPGATGPTLTLTRVPFSDDGAKIKCTVSGSGSATTEEATLNVTKDTVAPTIVSVIGSDTFNRATITFSEPVSKASAEKLSSYSADQGLAITAAVLQAAPNDDKVVLTTSAQTPGTTYQLTVKDVLDTATTGNPIASVTVPLQAYANVRGGLKFEAFLDIGTSAAIQGLLDAEKYINNQPDVIAYVSQFTSRLAFPDASHENYGGRISGWIVPPEDGQYEFFIRSDDASQLLLSPDESPAKAELIAQETGCCGPFEEPGAGDNGDGTFPTSAPIALTKGKRYYIAALWKEGGGGDYCDVAWRKVGDATSPRSLPYIPGAVLETVTAPTTFVAPSVAFSSPANESTFDTGVPVTLTATAGAATGKTVAKVEFFEGAKKIGEASQSPYSVTITGLSEDPHKFTARVTDSAGIFTDSAVLTVTVGKPVEELFLVKIDDATTWRYDRSGADLGTDWRGKAFDDSKWPAGKALIADETTTTVEPIRTPISRFNDDQVYVKTFYFRTKFTFNRLVNPFVRLQLRHVVDDGVIFYLNGKEIHRFGVTADPVDATSDAAGHENAYEGPYEIPVTDLLQGENVLAAEVHQSGGSSSDMVFGAELKAVIPLVPKQLELVKIDDKTSWRYDRSGNDLGTDWRARAYDDSKWPSGKALIADESTTTVEPIRTAISRFNDDQVYVKTFYFRTHFDLPVGSTAGAKLKLRHVVDDGAIFYLNGKEIHRFGITADPVDATSDAAGHENAYEGPYDIPITDLVPGDNVLAAEVHQSGGSSSDMVFGAELIASVLVQKEGEVVVETPKFTKISVSGGNLSLEWTGTGTLQSSAVVTGPYSDVNGAASPYAVSADAIARYFRFKP